MRQTQTQQTQYQEITRSYPPRPCRLDRLKHSVDVAKQIDARARLPDKTFGVVSQALDVNPEMSLTGLTWRHGRLGSEPAAPGQLAQSALLQIQLVAAPSDQKPCSPPSTSSPRT